MTDLLTSIALMRTFVFMRIWLSFVLLGLSIAAVAAPQPATGATILILGDSLSAAYRIPPESGWVALLERRLAGKMKSPPRVVNASISGETTTGALARLPGILQSAKPTICIVELGANDALQGQPVPNIEKNLRAILRACRDAGTKLLLVGTEIPVNYGPQYRDPLRSMYQALSREFNVPLVPFILEGVAMDESLLQPDGLHPTAAAEPRVLENVWPKLEPLLAEK
jgi:acyl-CoA thioesterase-1